MNERKYLIKEDWIFNLEASYAKLMVIRDDLEDGEISFPIEVAGRTVKDWDDLDSTLEEVGNLEWTAKSRRVTSDEYGRIKKFVHWRVEQRYFTCLASGMDEREAGRCFEDL